MFVSYHDAIADSLMILSFNENYPLSQDRNKTHIKLLHYCMREM